MTKFVYSKTRNQYHRNLQIKWLSKKLLIIKFFSKKKKKYWLYSSLQKRHVKKMFDKFFNFVRMLNHLTNFLKFIKIIGTHIDTNIKFISIFSKEKLFLKIKTISCGVWIMYSIQCISLSESSVNHSCFPGRQRLAGRRH